MAFEDAGGAAAVVALCAVLAVALRPRDAVLVAAGFVPLAAALPVLISIPVNWTELLIFTTAAGWLWRLVPAAGRSPNATFRAWAVAFGVAACASALALWWGKEWAAIPAPRRMDQWMVALVAELDHGSSPLRGALRLAAGAAMAACLADIAIGPLATRATRVLLFSVCALSALSFNRVAEIALRSPKPAERLLEVVASFRIAPIIGDPNALGALFLLLTPVALALCLSPGRRFAGGAALLCLAGGAWLAGSRTTIALTPMALAAVVVLRTGLPRVEPRWWVVSIAAIGVLTIGLMSLPTGRHVSASTAWTIRRDFGTVTARMLKDDPLFGVGQSQFYRRSAEYMPPSLSQYYDRENAHNQYFQIAGELGLVGAVPFLAMVGLVLARVRSVPRHDEAPGLAAGVVAFLVAIGAQHPLLGGSVGGAFWVAMGLLLACTPLGDRHPPRRASHVVWVIAALIAISIPVQAVRRARAETIAGVAIAPNLQRDKDETGPFWTSRRSVTVYMPAAAAVCELRLRARGIHGEASVEMAVDHMPAGEISVQRGTWRSYSVLVPTRRFWPLEHHRVDLSWTARPRGRVALDISEPVCR